MKSCKGTWFRAGSGLLICYVFDWDGRERELEWLVVGFLMLKMISVVRDDSLDVEMRLRLGAPDCEKVDRCIGKPGISIMASNSSTSHDFARRCSTTYTARYCYMYPTS